MYRPTHVLPQHYLEVSSQLCVPTVLPTRKRVPGTHSIGSCVEPRTGLDNVNIRQILSLPVFKLQTVGHPAHSQCNVTISSTAITQCM
jgi:hypothetical protein